LVIWILQAVLAVVFVTAGSVRLSQPEEKLADRMGWVADFSPPAVKVIGLLQVLAAAGLILPSLSGVLPWLTPLAAGGLVLVVSGASCTHVRRRDYSSIAMTAILLLMAATTANGKLSALHL